MTIHKLRCVIVYGALRSGTTLLRLMLNQHPELNCPGEADFLFDFLTFDEGGKAQLDIEALTRNRIFRDSLLICGDVGSPEQIILDLISQLDRESDQCLVIMLHRGIEKASRLLPEIPVIHLLRDPRDVARSSIGMGWAGTTFYGVDHWIETEQEWDRVIRDNSIRKITTLRYEDLITNPKKELMRVCKFLAVEFTAKMLNYHTSSTYSRPDPNLVEQWKRLQTPNEVALVEGRLGPMLSSRNYRPSDHRPMQPGRLEKFDLFCRNKVAVWRVRVERYGLIDPLIVAFSNRLGRTRFSHAAQQRMDNKVKQYLK